MEPKQLQCPECKSEDVRCDEMYTWGDVKIDEETKTIMVSQVDSEIQGYFCNACDHKIDVHELYPDYEHNFN